MRPPPNSDMTPSFAAIPSFDTPLDVNQSSGYQTPPSHAPSDLRADSMADGELAGSLVANARRAHTEGGVLDGLSAWSIDPRQTEGEQRAEAAHLIEQCYLQGLQTLDLSHLGLTSLPQAVWRLDDGNATLRGNPADPDGGRLQVLLLDHNRLMHLPEQIGQLQGLRKLSASANQLQALPLAIGELSCLTTLRIADNELVSLPQTLGKLHALERLSADGCLLNALPRSIGTLRALRQLDLEDNLLTWLPESVADLPGSCLVRVSANPLPLSVRQAAKALQTPIFLVDPIPVDTTDAGMPSVEQQARTLAELVFDWLILPQDRSTAALRRWQTREQYADAPALSQALRILAEIPEAAHWRTRARFRLRIACVLHAMDRRPGFAQECFELAATRLPGMAGVAENRARKWQRVSVSEMAYSWLQSAEALLLDADAQKYAWPMQDILRLAVRRYRLEALDRIVKEEAETIRFSDIVDIRLAYLIALGGTLDLEDMPVSGEHAELASTCTPEGESCGLSAPHLERHAVERAAERIKEEESSERLVEFLVHDPLWRAALLRHSMPPVEVSVGSYAMRADTAEALSRQWLNELSASG